MAVVETALSQTATMKLQIGQSATGQILTTNVGIGTLGEPSTWDSQKALNIVNAISPLLDRSLHQFVRTTTTEISEE